jgi:para-aminobenzoate synthetase component 1
LPNRWRIDDAPWPRNTLAAANDFSSHAELAWLDSVAGGPLRTTDSRFSLICARPCAILEQLDGQPARLLVQGRCQASEPDGWRLWRRVLNELPACETAPWRLSPGWVGYVGFEMARHLERLPASHAPDHDLPLMRLGLFDRAIVLDHLRQRALALYAPQVRSALGVCEDPDREWLESWSCAASADPSEPHLQPLLLQPERPPGQYKQAVIRALDYIAAGDIYQVNLAQRLRAQGLGDPLAVYAAIRRSNPSAYAAFLRWEHGAIASGSPELFLRLRGGRVLTRPIKGTRPRTCDPVADAASRRDLLTSAKEAAELAMIVDLHRNDLGRVCGFGSVRVEHPRRVEGHPTVFHTVADVSGRLAPGRDGLDLLRACFPAGSISGVPKIRALEIIDELEPVARGAYTGAVGVLGLDGQMTFNVAIRTVQICGPVALLHVGGGIVADSDPEAEHEETLAKARGIVSGLEIGWPAPLPARAARCGRTVNTI